MTDHPSTRIYNNSHYFASSRFKFLILPFCSLTTFNTNNLYAAIMPHKDYPEVGRLMQVIAIAPTDEREMNKSNMSRSGMAIYPDHALKPIFPGVIRGCSVQGRCIPAPSRCAAHN